MCPVARLLVGRAEAEVGLCVDVDVEGGGFAGSEGWESVMVVVAEEEEGFGLDEVVDVRGGFSFCFSSCRSLASMIAILSFVL